MKRLLILAIATLSLTGLIGFVVDQPSVSAQTRKEALQCYDKYHGKQFVNGSDELRKFDRNACAHKTRGNCKASSITGSGHYLEAKCTKKPESNGAAPGASTGGGSKSDPALDAASCTKDDCDLVSNYINPIINLLSILVGVAVAIGIIIGSIQVITSAGDPQKTANGKDHIRNAAIALVAYVLLYAFLQWVIPGGYL